MPLLSLCKKISLGAFLLLSFAAIAQAPSAANRRIVCEHAAPPAGTRWVCSNPEQPCNCHLEKSGALSDNSEEGSPQRVCPPPAVVSLPLLDYPPRMRAARIEGKVSLRAQVDPSGNVTRVDFVSGHPILTRAATKNLQHWIFAVQNCATVVNVTYDFRLDQPESTHAQTLVTFHLPYTIEVSAAPPAAQSIHSQSH